MGSRIVSEYDQQSDGMTEPEEIEVLGIAVLPYQYAIWCSVGGGEPFANTIESRSWSDDGEHIWLMLGTHNFCKCRPDELLRVVATGKPTGKCRDAWLCDCAACFMPRRPGYSAEERELAARLSAITKRESQSDREIGEGMTKPDKPASIPANPGDIAAAIKAMPEDDRCSLLLRVVGGERADLPRLERPELRATLPTMPHPKKPHWNGEPETPTPAPLPGNVTPGPSVGSDPPGDNALRERMQSLGKSRG